MALKVIVNPKLFPVLKTLSPTKAQQTALQAELKRERDANAARILAQKTAHFNQSQSEKGALFTARRSNEATRNAAKIAALTNQPVSVATPGQLVTTPAALSPAVSTTGSNGFTPSGYDPNAILATYAADGSTDSNNPAPVPSPASVSSASDSGSYVPSGYDPNAILQTYADDPANVVLSSSPSVIATPVDNSDINQLTSDPVMRTKLLAVKQSNPDYYAFITDYLKNNGVNSTLGDDATTTGTSSIAQIFSSILTPISQAYQAKIQSSTQLSPAQQQQRLLAMQQSNATLTGSSATRNMYLFGALALLGLAWYLTRKGR